LIASSLLIEPPPRSQRSSRTTSRTYSSSTIVANTIDRLLDSMYTLVAGIAPRAVESA